MIFLRATPDFFSEQSDGESETQWQQWSYLKVTEIRFFNCHVCCKWSSASITVSEIKAICINVRKFFVIKKNENVQFNDDTIFLSSILDSNISTAICDGFFTDKVMMWNVQFTYSLSFDSVKNRVSQIFAWHGEAADISFGFSFSQVHAWLALWGP